jgi:hypothetical protein
MAAGPDPGEPPTAEVFGTVTGGRSETVTLLERLTAAVHASPAASQVEEMSYRESLRHWAERAGGSLIEPRARPASRASHFIKSEFFDQPLSAEAVTAMAVYLVAARREGQARELDFTPWGGAYNRPSATATAFAHRTPLYLVKHTASVLAPAPTAHAAAAHQWANQSWQQLRRWGTGRVFPNFPDPDLPSWGPAYCGPNCQRLLTVKARYDPVNLFRSSHSRATRRSQGGPGRL